MIFCCHFLVWRVCWMVYTAGALSVNLIQNIGGSLSAACSFSVILTYWIFKDLRNLRYVELVFYVAVNDMIGSIGVGIGQQANNTFGCWFQGLTTNINYLSSAFWTTVIAYQVWLVVHHNKTLQNMKFFHIVCWGFPILVGLLPFTTNTYGNTDDTSTWCFISNVSNSPSWGILVWQLLSFYLWLWVAIALNLGLLLNAGRKIRITVGQNQTTVKVMYAKIQKLVYYPVILVISWLTSTVMDMYDLNHPIGYNGKMVYTYRMAIFLSTLEGFLMSIAFFAMNPIIRKKWQALLRSRYLRWRGGRFKCVLVSLEQHVCPCCCRWKGDHATRGTTAGPSDNNEDSTRMTLADIACRISVEDEPDYVPPKSTLIERGSTFVRESTSRLFELSHFYKREASLAVRPVRTPPTNGRNQNSIMRPIAKSDSQRTTTTSISSSAPPSESAPDGTSVNVAADIEWPKKAGGEVQPTVNPLAIRPISISQRPVIDTRRASSAAVSSKLAAHQESEEEEEEEEEG